MLLTLAVSNSVLLFVYVDGILNSAYLFETRWNTFANIGTLFVCVDSTLNGAYIFETRWNTFANIGTLFVYVDSTLNGAYLFETRWNTFANIGTLFYVYYTQSFPVVLLNLLNSDVECLRVRYLSLVSMNRRKTCPAPSVGITNK
jgi:hypothetical protein